MNGKLVPGYHFKKLIKCAKTSGKYDGRIAELVHFLFPDMHIINNEQFRNASCVVVPIPPIPAE